MEQLIGTMLNNAEIGHHIALCDALQRERGRGLSDQLVSCQHQRHLLLFLLCTHLPPVIHVFLIRRCGLEDVD
jgi:hypothetical protein